jgi:hypothetical protein
MGQKKSLNQKRLTRNQVRELIETEGKLHKDFTAFFAETYSSGYKNQPLIYELPGDRFLFVFDPKQSGIGGKGDIYTKAHFLRWIKWHQKVEEDGANNRASSIEHWRYYSQHKNDIIHKVDELINQLAERWQISDRLLDFSYPSLDILSNRAENYGIERLQVEFYDNLVAYVGEVMRRRVNGQWAIESYPNFPGMYVVAAPLDPSDFSNFDWTSFQPEPSAVDRDYPSIKADRNGRSGILMPINVVWTAIDGLEPVNLRRETANEIRRFSLECR